MIPWFADWAGVHCDRFGLDPEKAEVNLKDIQEFFDKNAVTLTEAAEASSSLAANPPKFPSGHLQALKAKVFSLRAAKYVPPEDTKPSASELSAAKKHWREFMESRNKRKERTKTA